ncbi:hypothetical protein A311_03745 [Escherichia coli KTE146]|nr:hypothetical protein [Escherichia coli]ELG86341.1 hypothetical protein A311_03745 [Escherichia coli KTE146]
MTDNNRQYILTHEHLYDAWGQLWRSTGSDGTVTVTNNNPITLKSISKTLLKNEKCKIYLNQCIIAFKVCKKLMTGLFFRVNVCRLIKRKKQNFYTNLF